MIGLVSAHLNLVLIDIDFMPEPELDRSLLLYPYYALGLAFIRVPYSSHLDPDPLSSELGVCDCGEE